MSEDAADFAPIMSNMLDPKEGLPACDAVDSNRPKWWGRYCQKIKEICVSSRKEYLGQLVLATKSKGLEKLYSLEQKTVRGQTGFGSGRRTHHRQRWGSTSSETEDSFRCATQANPKGLHFGDL